MTRTTIATAVTTTLLAAALLSGCGGGGQPAASSSSMPNVEAPPSSSSVSSAPATSRPTSSKSSRSVEMAGAPGVPKPARMHTKAGAEAFARHYMTVVDRTGMHPKSGELEPLGLRECKSCDAYEGNVAYLEGNGLHNSGPAAKLRRSAVQDGDHGKDVFLKVDQLPITLLTKDGRVAESDPAVAGIVLVFHLKWTAGGWRISEIQKSAIGMPT